MSNTRVIFLKPVRSKIKEMAGDKQFYYIAKVGDYAKTLRKYGLGHLSYGSGDWSQDGCARYLTKNDIERLPKYLRRGGEYGHDPIKIPNYSKIDTYSKNIIKLYNLEVVMK